MRKSKLLAIILSATFITGGIVTSAPITDICETVNVHAAEVYDESFDWSTDTADNEMLDAAITGTWIQLPQSYAENSTETEPLEPYYYNNPYLYIYEFNADGTGRRYFGYKNDYDNNAYDERITIDRFRYSTIAGNLNLTYDRYSTETGSTPYEINNGILRMTDEYGFPFALVKYKVGEIPQLQSTNQSPTIPPTSSLPIDSALVGEWLIEDEELQANGALSLLKFNSDGTGILFAGKEEDYLSGNLIYSDNYIQTKHNIQNGMLVLSLYYENSRTSIVTYTYKIEGNDLSLYFGNDLILALTKYTSSSNPIEPAVALGDVNNDGYIDSSDATLVLAEYAKIQTGTGAEFPVEQKTAADVNKDGMIDSSDASKILAYYAMISTGQVPSWD